MAEKTVYLNGIDGDTGAYDLPPMTTDELLRVLSGEATPENLDELRNRALQETSRGLGTKEGVDPRDISAAGWGIIFPDYDSSDPDREAKTNRVDAIREALRPLLRLRDQQTRGRFPEWVQGQGKEYWVGVDSKNDYLARHGMGPGPVDPDKVPYYLLIVGSPRDIPYRFQSQLDVQYAVGRIDFDTVQDYAYYTASVVDAERNGTSSERTATFFSVSNPDDRATQLSTSRLMVPLADRLMEERPDSNIHVVPTEDATKDTLVSLFGGERKPMLLFSAGHGMMFEKNSDRQLPHQGALLCRDWPGPMEWRQAIPQDFYFAGDDLDASADLRGMIAFFLACYGGGTPQYSEYARQENPGSMHPTRREIAPYPFLARLPVKMLGRQRGALAVVSHVERAWGYSFDWGKAGPQITVFESTIKRLLDGHPVGYAMEYLNGRYAELSTMLSDELEEIEFGKQADTFELARLWTANNDARGYAIIGDPAVRLPGANRIDA